MDDEEDEDDDDDDADESGPAAGSSQGHDSRLYSMLESMQQDMAAGFSAVHARMDHMHADINTRFDQLRADFQNWRFPGSPPPQE